MQENRGVIIPIENFRQPVKDMIEKVTGKSISMKEFLAMDSGKIRRILGVVANPPIKMRRGDPGPLYKVVDPEYKRCARALVSGIIEKYEKSIKGI